MLQDVGSYRALAQGLPSQDNRFPGWLKRSPPSFPLAGGVGGGCSDGASIHCRIASAIPDTLRTLLYMTIAVDSMTSHFPLRSSSLVYAFTHI
jgi:hypothetical protein